MVAAHLDTDRHPIDDTQFVERCRRRLAADGVLVLQGFFTAAAVQGVVAESGHRALDAYYAASTHNVYLSPCDPSLPADHPFNRQVVSSKGLVADDQIPPDSALRAVYDDERFRSFLCGVLGVDELHPYADPLSSINVHFAAEGQELGWHFDNSSFAVTMLLRAPEAGGVFEYVRDARDAASGDMGYERVAAVLDGTEVVERLDIEAGDLVLFRGRDALHRVTPTEGSVTRMLVVFAFNDEPGIALSESALSTFYGRTS
jgi:hypothetical protein